MKVIKSGILIAAAIVLFGCEQIGEDCVSVGNVVGRYRETQCFLTAESYKIRVDYCKQLKAEPVITEEWKGRVVKLDCSLDGQLFNSKDKVTP